MEYISTNLLRGGCANRNHDGAINFGRDKDTSGCDGLKLTEALICEGTGNAPLDDEYR